MEKLPNNIRELRKERGLSLDELSDQLRAGFTYNGIRESANIPKTTLIRYEKGESRIKNETLGVIANFFDTTPNYIMKMNRPVEMVRADYIELDVVDIAEADVEYARLKQNKPDNKDDEQLYNQAVKSVAFGTQHDVFGAIKLVMDSVEKAKFQMNEYRDYVDKDALLEIIRTIDVFRIDLDRLKSELR